MSTLIHLQTMTIDGLSIRFAQGGTGPRHAMLLTHGPKACSRSSRLGRGWPRPRIWSPLISPDSAAQSAAKR